MSSKVVSRKINYHVDKKNGLSKQKLEQLLFDWKKKLLMDDWNIKLKIVDFERKDFRQSGNFVADSVKKKAEILMTYDPWRGDEEYTLVHEMIHILMNDFDQFSEKFVIKNGKSDQDHETYLGQLEKVVHQLTQSILGRPEPKG